MYHISNNNVVEKDLAKADELLDYYNFFTNLEVRDMLIYAYLESSYYYDNLILYNKKYYLFSDEVKIISKNKIVFEKFLTDVKEIFEIGPGSPHVIKNKTIPILECCKNINKYCIIDHSKNYMFDAYKFLKNKLKSIDIELYEGKLLNLEKLSFKLKEYQNQKKAFMLLGSTIGNFTLEKQKKIINGFAELLDDGDLLFITTDTNQNEKILMDAYYNKYAIAFVDGILKHYSKTNIDFIKYLNSFDIFCNWNRDMLSVSYNFIAKDNIAFNHLDGKLIEIEKGKRLNGVNSYKIGKEQFYKLLTDSGLSVVEELENSRISIFICVKH